MKNIRLIDATHLDKRIYNDIPMSVFGNIKKMAAMREIVEEEPTVEAVPLSWWRDLKETITELRDNNEEDKECDAYKIGRFLCNMIDIIEKRGSQNGTDK